MNLNPKWFVQTQDKTIHGYFSKDVLMCDLALRKDEPVTILELKKGVVVRYIPITKEELKERK